MSDSLAFMEQLTFKANTKDRFSQYIISIAGENVEK